MNSLIKKRAKERSFELEKAERAQQMAEALVVSAESKQAVNVHSYAPIPPSASSPTLSKIRSALGSPGMGALTEDGDASDHSKTEKGYIAGTEPKFRGTWNPELASKPDTRDARGNVHDGATGRFKEKSAEPSPQDDPDKELEEAYIKGYRDAVDEAFKKGYDAAYTKCSQEFEAACTKHLQETEAKFSRLISEHQKQMNALRAHMQQSQGSPQIVKVAELEDNTDTKKFNVDVLRYVPGSPNNSVTFNEWLVKLRTAVYGASSNGRGMLLECEVTAEVSISEYKAASLMKQAGIECGMPEYDRGQNTCHDTLVAAIIAKMPVQVQNYVQRIAMKKTGAYQLHDALFKCRILFEVTTANEKTSVLTELKKHVSKSDVELGLHLVNYQHLITRLEDASLLQPEADYSEFNAAVAYVVEHPERSRKFHSLLDTWVNDNMSSALETSSHEFHAYLQRCIDLADEIYGAAAKGAGEIKNRGNTEKEKRRASGAEVQDILIDNKDSQPREVLSGTVKSWIVDKGFGFITPQDGDEEVIVHHKALGDAERLHVGDGVKYELFFDEAKQKHRAENVAVVATSPESA